MGDKLDNAYLGGDLPALYVPTCTVATAPAASANTGRIIYVTDGAAGSPCLALSTGSSWLAITSGSAISAT